MRHRYMTVIVAAASVGATLSGCSSKECAGNACASFGNVTARVVIDQRDESITGSIICGSEGGGKMTIDLRGPGTSRLNVSFAGSNVKDLLIVEDNVMYDSSADSNLKMTRDGNHYSFTGHLNQSGGSPAPSAVTVDVTCP
jgi:Mycobacterium 19 kDa lipoprotein antigen